MCLIASHFLAIRLVGVLFRLQSQRDCLSSRIIAESFASNSIVVGCARLPSSSLCQYGGEDNRSKDHWSLFTSHIALTTARKSVCSWPHFAWECVPDNINVFICGVIFSIQAPQTIMVRPHRLIPYKSRTLCTWLIWTALNTDNSGIVVVFSETLCIVVKYIFG